MQHKINAGRSKSSKNGLVGMNLSEISILLLLVYLLCHASDGHMYLFKLILRLETEDSKVHQVGYFK